MNQCYFYKVSAISFTRATVFSDFFQGSKLSIQRFNDSRIQGYFSSCLEDITAIVGDTVAVCLNKDLKASFSSCFVFISPRNKDFSAILNKFTGFFWNRSKYFQFLLQLSFLWLKRLTAVLFFQGQLSWP